MVSEEQQAEETQGSPPVTAETTCGYCGQQPRVPGQFLCSACEACDGPDSPSWAVVDHEQEWRGFERMPLGDDLFTRVEP